MTYILIMRSSSEYSWREVEDRETHGIRILLVPREEKVVPVVQALRGSDRPAWTVQFTSVS